MVDCNVDHCGLWRCFSSHCSRQTDWSRYCHDGCLLYRFTHRNHWRRILESNGKEEAALELKVSEVLDDGVITTEEAAELATLQQKLGLSDEQMTAIISGLQDRQ